MNIRKAKILVTGGLGYIGSHTVVELMAAGYEVVIIDNLSNSQLFILDCIEKIAGSRPTFYRMDVSDKTQVLSIFTNEIEINAVIHFAAFKAVGESMQNPLKYFRNNLTSLINLLECMEENNCTNIVFSSSATVYGDPDQSPVKESTPIKRAISPYGSTKQMGEEILEKTSETGKINAVSLRYFNPVGSHASALLGELPSGVPNNLMPFVCQTAAGIRDKLVIYGNDYNTADGTCIRDYIHVVDLALAHVNSCERLLNGYQVKCFEAFNIGTGKGISVLEIIKAFEKYNRIPIKYSFGPRRAGDAAIVYADVSKAEREIRWKAASDLQSMVRSSWEWQKSLTNLQKRVKNS
jgi:UDP-glucose 4-epimerase